MRYPLLGLHPGRQGSCINSGRQAVIQGNGNVLSAPFGQFWGLLVQCAYCRSRCYSSVIWSLGVIYSILLPYGAWHSRNNLYRFTAHITLMLLMCHPYTFQTPVRMWDR